jgi:hypothetical protein
VVIHQNETTLPQDLNFNTTFHHLSDESANCLVQPISMLATAHQNVSHNPPIQANDRRFIQAVRRGDIQQTAPFNARFPLTAFQAPENPPTCPPPAFIIGSREAYIPMQSRPEQIQYQVDQGAHHNNTPPFESVMSTSPILPTAGLKNLALHPR